MALTKVPIFASFEDLTYDWRLRATANPSDARPDIALVLINESSVRELEPIFGRWPWPRFVHSGVIDFFTRAGARVVAYDVLFIDRDRKGDFEVAGRRMTGPESDAELVAAVKRAGNVVLLADAVYGGTEQGRAADAGVDQRRLLKNVYRPGPELPARPTLLLPYEDLAAVALSVGHNYAKKDASGVARTLAPFVEWQGVAVPSLGAATAIAAAGIAPGDVRVANSTLHLGSAQMPLLTTGDALLNLHGPFRAESGTFTYPTFSFFDVLLSEDQAQRGEKPAIDPAVFKNKLVFVGTSADGMSDIWQTPFSIGGMPGVQLHAAQADDVLARRFMRRASTRADTGVSIGVAVAAGIVATVLPVVWGVPLALAGAAGLGAWLTHAVGGGVWIAAVAPLSGILLAVFGGVAWQYFVEGRAKRQVTRLFGRYVSRDVFEHLMADPSVARLGGGRREMTVLFSDIRGFTTATEEGEPEAVVQQLNEYFTEMVDVLFRHQGTLDKFVGDMVMGLFGAPVADPQHADHAVAAALEMSEALDRLNARWAAEGRPTVNIGIGVNSGEMIAGNIGSSAIMSYTVIGDAVNLGARLESLNKEYGTRILISEETRRRLTTEVETRLIGDVTVKGKSKSVTVYEVKASARPRA